MSNHTRSTIEDTDPAAVFACALSLWTACHERAAADLNIDLSGSYQGVDEFMRVVMRIGTQFEVWACDHVSFEELSDVWPYLLEDQFGKACLEVLAPTNLAEFSEKDCLRVALRLRIPLIIDDALPIPMDMIAQNSIAESSFRAFRIQTIRDHLGDDMTLPFVVDDDPFDEEFGKPYFGLYGVHADGTLEHIADRSTFSEMLELAKGLAPEAEFTLRRS